MREQKHLIKGSQDSRHGAPNEKPITLHPLDFDEALSAILKVQPERKEKQQAEKNQSVKKK